MLANDRTHNHLGTLNFLAMDWMKSTWTGSSRRPSSAIPTGPPMSRTTAPLAARVCVADAQKGKGGTSDDAFGWARRGRDSSSASGGSQTNRQQRSSGQKGRGHGGGNEQPLTGGRGGRSIQRSTSKPTTIRTRRVSTPADASALDTAEVAEDDGMSPLQELLESLQDAADPAAALLVCKEAWRAWAAAGYRKDSDRAPSAAVASVVLRALGVKAKRDIRRTIASSGRDPCVRGLLGILAQGERVPLRCLAAGAWAAAALGGPNLFQDEMEALILKLPQATRENAVCSDISDLIWGLATSRHTVSRSVMSDLEETAMDLGGLERLSAQDATALLWGMAILAYMPSRLLQKSRPPSWQPRDNNNDDLQQGQVASACGCELPALSDTELSTCAWALAVAGAHKSSAIIAVWQELCARGPKGLSRTSLLRTHQAKVSLELEAGVAVRSLHPRSGALMAAARGVWARDGSNLGRKQMSHLHRELGDALTQLGLEVLVETTISGYSVDIALPGHALAVEADGPSHFSRNSGQPLGPTLLKRRHLTAMGWTVVSVTVEAWEDQIGKSQRHLYLKELLSPLIPEDAQPWQ